MSTKRIAFSAGDGTTPDIVASGKVHPASDHSVEASGTIRVGKGYGGSVLLAPGPYVYVFNLNSEQGMVEVHIHHGETKLGGLKAKTEDGVASRIVEFEVE